MQADDCFLGCAGAAPGQEGEKIVIQTAVDDVTQCVFMSFVRQKGGADEYVVKGLMSWLDTLGYVTTALRSDTEASMQDLLRTVTSRRSRATIV